MTAITLKGYILIPEKDLQAVTAALPEHARLTRMEQGCISFSVIQDLDNPLRFNVSETFSDRQAFDLHQKRVSESAWGRIAQNVERFYELYETQVNDA